MRYRRNSRTHEILANDVIDHLTDDFSQHDRVYAKLGQRKVGKKARIDAAERAYWEMESFKFHHTETPVLFPEFEIDELRVAMQGFAKKVGREYVDILVYETIHKDRPYIKEIFPYPDGVNRCAVTYLESVWAPRYAAEFALAHELGLTRDYTQELAEITGGAETI